MAKKIEILENTLLKLLTRRGLNEDRNTSNIIYFKTAIGTGSATWLAASQFLSAGDATINIDSGSGKITVGTLSAGNLHNDIVGNSIELVSGRISLSGTQIKTDRISANSITHLKLPGDLNINSVDYTFPVGGLGSGQYYLGADASGTLTWSAPG